MTTPTSGFAVGDTVTLKATRMAHGGEAIAHHEDGRVVFLAGAVPGDTVRAEVTKAKKRWARAQVTEVIEASEHRIDSTCPAAAAGAGCCDYSVIDPDAQLTFKHQVLVGQLRSLAGQSGVLDDFDFSSIVVHQLAPTLGWRTRVRLGVDEIGRAGLRRAKSNQVVTEACTQNVPGLANDLPGMRFTPGSEVIAVMDSLGNRHIVESTKSGRGRRTEVIEKIVEGTGEVTERADDHTFSFPATAFWQAHTDAPDTYARIIRSWAKDSYDTPVGWDLYGGVGVFIPAIADALGPEATVYSVDYSKAVARGQQKSLEDYRVEWVNGRVEFVVEKLARPGLVVLDPPRTGAGAVTVAAVAEQEPEQVIHIGCDPATLARDLGDWGQAGYRVKRMVLIDAFPNTHHFEVMVELGR